MKAISLWQPWASLMAVGLKQNETRHWPTRHTGELAIHAAKRKPAAGDISNELAALIWEQRARFEGFHGNIKDLIYSLPYGKIVCVVDLRDCQSTDFCLPTISDDEWTCGNYSLGRYAWRTENYRRLTHEIPIAGRQGFFNLPPEVEVMVRAQLT